MDLTLSQYNTKFILINLIFSDLEFFDPLVHVFNNNMNLAHQVASLQENDEFYFEVLHDFHLVKLRFSL